MKDKTAQAELIAYQLVGPVKRVDAKIEKKVEGQGAKEKLEARQTKVILLRESTYGHNKYLTVLKVLFFRVGGLYPFTLTRSRDGALYQDVQ